MDNEVKYRVLKFRERFVFAMKNANMKQIVLAEKTGISRAQICEYMKGKYIPKQDKLYLIAKALDINPVWLLGYDVPMRNEIDSTSKLKKELHDIIETSSEAELTQIKEIIRIMFPTKVR